MQRGGWRNCVLWLAQALLLHSLVGPSNCAALKDRILNRVCNKQRQWVTATWPGLTRRAFVCSPLPCRSVGRDQRKKPPEEDFLLIMDPICQGLSSDILQSQSTWALIFTSFWTGGGIESVLLDFRSQADSSALNKVLNTSVIPSPPPLCLCVVLPHPSALWLSTLFSWRLFFTYQFKKLQRGLCS